MELIWRCLLLRWPVAISGEKNGPPAKPSAAFCTIDAGIIGQLWDPRAEGGGTILLSERESMILNNNVTSAGIFTFLQTI